MQRSDRAERGQHFRGSLILLMASLLLSSQAGAVVFSKMPCTPLFVAGPQGRPMPDAAVAVSLPNGIAATGIWLDPAGAQIYNYVVPSNQIIQFYMDDPGVYQVTVSSSGTTKNYYTICGYGINTPSPLISIDRTADVLLINTISPPTFSCPTDYPCQLEFDDEGGQWLLFDFVLPSYAVDFSELRLGIISGNVAICSILWEVGSCTYAAGALVCNVTLAPDAVSVAVTAPVAGKRYDVVFSSSVWTPVNWLPNRHVIVYVKRPTGDQCAGIEALQNARLELSR